MAKKASSERTQFWRELIGRQRTSGLNIGRFCEQAGVSQNSFYVWKRRLHSDQSFREGSNRQGRSIDSTRSKRPENTAMVAKSLVPVRLVADPVKHPAPTAGAIEVNWPNGVALRVPSGCNPDTLRDIFRMLTSAMSGEAASC